MKVGTFTTAARLSVAMALILGLATIAAAQNGVGINQVDIADGLVDLDESGFPGPEDDAFSVLLWCNDADPVAVNIVNGAVDVTQGGVVGTEDDLLNCDLNDENGGVPTTNQVDIINGLIDVNESGLVDTSDDANNVQLFQMLDLP